MALERFSVWGGELPGTRFLEVQSVTPRVSYKLRENIKKNQSVTPRASYKLQEEGQSVWQGTVQERVDSIAASPRAYLVRRPAKNVISPPPLKKRNNSAK